MALIKGNLQKQGVKAVQFIGSPFQGKKFEELKKSPKRLLIPWSLSAEEALKLVKQHLGVGTK